MRKLVTYATFMMSLVGCGEDEPFLYFSDVPSASRTDTGKVSVEGHLWSVVEWPDDNRFCIGLVADGEVTRECQDSVSTTIGGSGHRHDFLLVTDSASDASEVTIDVISDYFGNARELSTTTVSVVDI